VGALAVTIPAMLAVRLRLPRLRPVIEGLSLLPLVIPPIALVVGVRDVLSLGPNQLAGTPLGDALVSSQDVELPWVLVVVYIVLALPFVYRALDAGFGALDVRTLVDAARGLGASWATVVFRVLLPNLRSAALGAAFLTIALVLGEYTVASILLFQTLPTWLVKISGENAQESVAVSVASLLFTWLLLARRVPRRSPPSHREEVEMTEPTASEHRRHPRAREASRDAEPQDRPPAGASEAWERDDRHADRADPPPGRTVARRPAVGGCGGSRRNPAPRPDRGTGELVALLGPSGCGKTTALRVLAGFDTPDEGTVRVGGADITAQPPNRRGMGMVFQAFSLFPNLTVLDNVAFGLGYAVQPRPCVASARRAARARRPRATANRYPHQISAVSSSGWRWPGRWPSSRACCCSTSRSPRWTRRCGCSCATRSAGLQQRLGITTLFVTHDQGEALSMRTGSA
jgi:putative spermidine/putrescine transport system permease protein